MMKDIQYTSSEKRSVRKLLLSWFADNQRDLPWRDEYEPYQVWISEIMGQQTQMDRVVRYFNRWMELFPDIAAVNKGLGGAGLLFPGKKHSANSKVAAGKPWRENPCRFEPVARPARYRPIHCRGNTLHSL